MTENMLLHKILDQTMELSAKYSELDAKVTVFIDRESKTIAKQGEDISALKEFKTKTETEKQLTLWSLIVKRSRDISLVGMLLWTVYNYAKTKGL